jgi:hypothetical protein
MPDQWKPVTYDPDTRQLSAIPASFADRDLSVLSIVWESGIDAGFSVSPGDELAIIQWEDNSREAILAPEECGGSILAVNRNIMFEDLPYEPAIWLIVFAGE